MNKRHVTINEILETAARQVRCWPKWLQRPEYRQRPPAGNTPPSDKALGR